MMAPDFEKQVFYDPTRNRWFFSKISIFVFGMILSLSFGLVVLRTLKQSDLPLSNPTSSNLISRKTVKPYAVQKEKDRNIPTSNFNTTDSATIQNSASSDQIKVLGEHTNKDGTNQTVYAYFVNWDQSSFASLKKNISHIDVLVPEWLQLSNEQGELILNDQPNQERVMKQIKATRPELKIIPLISNFNSSAMGWDSQKIAEMLKNPAYRQNNIVEIFDYVTKNDFAGISIDYEAVPDESRLNFSLFIKELYQTFHPQGLKVLVNLPLDDPDFDFAAISANTDFVVLMAYDQNAPYGGRPNGPIASQDWISNALKLKTGQLPPEKIILSLGNYGYDWPDQNSSQTPARDLTFAEVMNLAREKNPEIKMDENSLNPRFDYYDENGNLRHVWFLDGPTAYNHAKTANSFGIFDIAVWRLGSEDPAVWPILSDLTIPHKQIGQAMVHIDFNDTIQNQGSGEVLRVTKAPSAGKRKITIDASKNLVVGESYESFPDPFIIQRWGKAEKKLAITFDDGPDANYTTKILDVLKSKDAKATFFIIGANAAKNQDIVKRIDQEGNEIGSHTFSHPNISNISEKQLIFELNLVESMLEGSIKKNTLLFRPPYAEDVEPQTPGEILPLLELSSLGYYTVSMNIDPTDWGQPGTDILVGRVAKALDEQRGNILLLHDGGGDRQQTVEALPKIIEEARKRGYQLVTVSELMGLKKDDVMPAISSNKKLASGFSWIAFIFTDFSLNFLKIFFILAIVLGLARFAVVGFLAIIQKILSYKRARLLRDNSYRPRVSVIIPAYNEEKVIIKTVQSILDSDYKNLNVIVVDDGSSDRTYKVLQDNYSNDDRISILTQTNSGKPEALNLGISYAQTDIVVTLDADTIFQKDTISNLIRHFENPKIGAVAGNAKVGNRINILTYWQALEYITSQNLDRRAFDLLNCITVVPGSIGAWRKKVVLEAGGFQDRTLAEDSDLTFFVIRRGYRVVYEENAIAWTEAPDTVKNFIKQRFRWMYGTFQSAWLHKKAIFEKKSGLIGIVSIPNIFVFQIIFPLLSPIVDIALAISLAWIGWQKYHHPLDFNALHSLDEVITFYAIFLVVDFLTSSIAFFLERRENWKLLFWIFPQRFFYRQLMYYVAIKVFVSVLRGKLVGWGKFERKATVTLKPQPQEVLVKDDYVPD